MADYKFLTYETLDEGKIARIYMNRAETRNAQNRGPPGGAQRRIPCGGKG